MSVIQENRDVLLKELRVAKVLPHLRKHLPEFLITEVENQLTIRRKNEKLLDILRKRDDGPQLLKVAITNTYPHLLYLFDDTSSEDENAPPRPPPPRAPPKKSLSRQISEDLFKSSARPSDYRANNNNNNNKPDTSAPKIMPKPKVMVTPRYNQPANGVSPSDSKKEDAEKLKQLEGENSKLKKEVNEKTAKLAELERNKPDSSMVRELSRLKNKYENLEREKDMVVTEKLAMETEQSIIAKENEFLKKMKNSAPSKREIAQAQEEKGHAEAAKDEAIRENTRLRRELDELQRQIGDVTYEKDLREDEKRRELRDKSRLEKECERLREELSEERKHAQKLSSSSVPMPQYEKVQDELGETRKEVRTANRERDAAIQEKNSLLMDRKSGESAEMRNLQEKIAQLGQQIQKITDEKNNIAFENAMLTDQLNASVAGVDDIKNERKQLLEQNDLMRSDIEHLLKEREEIMDELEDTRKAQTGSSGEKDATIRSLRHSLTNQQNITDTFEEKFNEAQRKSIKLTEEAKLIAEREDSLIEERDVFKENCNGLQANIDKLTEERDMAMSDYDKMFKECEDLRKLALGASGEKDVLINDHQQALDEIEKLHAHIAEIERSAAPIVVPEVARPVESRPTRHSESERVASPPPAPTSYAPDDEDAIEDRDWRSEIKVIILNKAKHGARSFGFTIGGGIDNPHYKDNPDDSHIYVLRVQQEGVADGVLHRDDAILSVNGTDLNKVKHEHAVNTLTSSGDCIELVIRRKFLPEAIKIINLSPYLDRGLGFSIIGGKSEDVTQDPGIYIAKVLSGGAAEAEGVIDKGDRILTINSSYVVNVSRKYAEGLLSSLEEQCVLRVAKPLTNLTYLDGDDEAIDGGFTQPPGSYGRRGKSTEDLRRPMSPGQDLFGPPANFKDTRNMNRAGSTPQLHDDRLYQNHMPPPMDPLKRSSSQGHLLRNRPDQGYDLQRSRSQDWNSPMMHPRNEAPKFAMRRVNIRRPNLQTSLGLEVYTAQNGQSGIFVNKLDKQGLSYRSGLRCADQILEVNGRNLRNATHDEAVGILSSNVNLNLICQQSPKQFGEMHQSMRSGFFVRALYSFSAGLESGLSFKESDVFHVVDSQSMEQDGWWLALLLRGPTALQCGEIPSHHRAIQYIQQKFGPPTDSGGKKGKKSLLGKAFKKSDGRDGISQTSSVDDQYMNDILPYEPVVRKDLAFCRPIIILGPLTELLNDRLVNDCPDWFNRCILYTTRDPERGEVDGRDFWFVSQQQIDDIQAGRQADKFVECRHINGHTYYYSANAIKEVARQNKHCVLNVGIHSIDRLHSVDLFPIVIFVKFKSPQDLRRQFNDRCSIEQAQKVFEKAVKLEKGFADKFSATFSGESMEDVFLMIKDFIGDNATNVMWVKQN